jgi:hypothetical protein
MRQALRGIENALRLRPPVDRRESRYTAQIPCNLPRRISVNR